MAVRLGDIIDDHCNRCHRLTDHSVVAMVGDDVKKVRCRTCNNEHDYRHGKVPEKKKPKLSAYEEVLASIMASKPAGTSAATPPEKVSRTPSRSGLAARTRSSSKRRTH